VKRMGAYNRLNSDESCSYHCEHTIYHFACITVVGSSERQLYLPVHKC
jgi:hypothetical protein